MFADYRVPQALAYLGVLEYSPELLSKLGPGKRLEAGSEEEVVMRGASIWACEVNFTSSLILLKNDVPSF